MSGAGAKSVRLTRRMWFNVTLCLIACALLYVWHRAHGLTLAHPSLVTGWSLMALMAFLTAYNLRKKLAFLPLTSSATWLQMHLYAGFLAMFGFGLHVGPNLPNGALETTLYVVFFGVSISGLLGIYMSRWIPPRLSTRGEEVIFERIPGFYQRQRAQVKELVLEAARDIDSTAIPDLYARSLHDFFSGPRNRWLHLRESRRPLQQILREMGDLERFLTAEEKEILGRVEACVRVKDDLDYKYIHMAVLKYWLFVHIPLAYCALALALLHVLLVHAYGGIR